MKQIKWGCIQPLTGGMYIGARQAIGTDASWIISYPGTNETKYDKEGTLISAGNEYNLTQGANTNEGTTQTNTSASGEYFKFGIQVKAAA